MCQRELTEFLAELTEFAAELSEFYLSKQCSRICSPPVSYHDRYANATCPGLDTFRMQCRFCSKDHPTTPASELTEEGGCARPEERWQQ